MPLSLKERIKRRRGSKGEPGRVRCIPLEQIRLDLIATEVLERLEDFLLVGRCFECFDNAFDLYTFAVACGQFIALYISKLILDIR